MGKPIRVHQPSPMPPDIAVQEALGETNRKLLQGYSEAIRILRDEKGFTFREIAEWLTERDIDADHNEVYRIYTKGMSEGEAAEAAHLDDEDEKQGL